MIYAEWYFCYQARLGADEAARYMEILYALKEERVPGIEKVDALRRLDRLELLLQGYAIPLLVKILFSYREKKAYNDWGENEKKDYVYNIKILLNNVIGQKKALSRLIDILDSGDNGKIVKLIKGFVSQHGQDREEIKSFDYLQTDTVVEEVLILSVLKGLVQTIPDQISPIVRGEEQADLIKLALNGAYGQLAWNLAVEILGLCNEPIFNLMELFPEDWFTRPDLMEIVARIKYRGNMEQLMNESCKFVFFKDCFHLEASYFRNFWAAKSISKEEFIKSCAVMWQGILWSYALEADPERTMDHLAKLWDLSDHKDAERNFFHPNFIQKCFIPFKSNAYVWEDVVRLVACPWVEPNKTGNKDKNFGRYGKLRQNSTALRIFMAIPIMQSIFFRLRSEDSVTEQITLLLHWGKLFLTKGVKYISRRPEELYVYDNWIPWDPPVCLLGTYTNRVLERMGTGKINSLVPDWIMDELEEEERQDACARIQYLYEIDAFKAAAHWAALSLAERGNGDDNPWFVGKNSSCAAGLCRIIFTQKPKVENDRDALLLAYQAYPQYIPVRQNQWVKAYIQNKNGMVQASELLCEQKPDLEAWRSLNTLNLERFQQDAGKIALTMRLFEAYLSMEIGSDNEWFLEWMDCFSAIQQNSEFSGLSRYELMKMFRLRPKYSESRGSLRDVLRLIVQAVDEFTDYDTAYYQQLLIQALGEENPVLGERTYDGFCIQLIEDLYKELYWNKERAWDMEMEHRNKLLFSFLMDNAERFCNEDVKSELVGFWEKKYTGRQPARLEELNDVDALQVITCNIWERDGGRIAAVKSREDIKKVKGDRKAEVKNLFEKKEEIREECWYVSIIADKHKIGDDVKYTINYGGKETDTYNTKDSRYRVGDVVLVSFCRGKINEIRQEAFEKKDGDWVLGTYMLEGNRMCVKAMGEKEWKTLTTEMLNRWCPDLSLMFLDKPIEGKCLVEWEQNTWLPVTRDFLQLIVEQILRQENPNREVSLVLIKRTKQSGRDMWIFSAGIGYNYGVYRENLDKKCLAELEKRVGEPDMGAGLILNMKLGKGANGTLVLALCEEKPVDDKNIRWKSQFDGEERFVVYKDENGDWYVNSKVPEIAERIKANPLKVSGNDRKASKLNVQLRNWDTKCQRSGVVDVELVESRKLEAGLGLEDINNILHMRGGRFLTLDYVNCESTVRGYHLAVLENGVVVKCAAESFSPYNIKKTEAGLLYKKRKCIVEYVDEKVRRAENEKLIPCFVEELEGCEYSMRGVVEDIPKGLGEGSDLEITVCLIDGQRIRHVKAPANAFSPMPFYTGEPVETECRDGENWVFRVRPRIIYVRALWELDNHKADMECIPQGTSLGIVDINGMGMGLMTCIGTPVLHFYRPEMESDCAESEEVKVPDRLRGSGRWVVYRKCDTSLFENTFLTSIITVSDEKNEFIGEASSNIDWDNVTEWQIRHEVHKFVDNEGEVYYDLRRVFVPADADIQEESGKRLEQKEEQVKRYCQWCAQGNFHATGSMKKAGNGYDILLHNLSVPADVNKTGEEDEWQNRIHMLTGEYPSREERNYDTEDVRVKLHIEDTAWVASYQETDFMQLTEFASYFGAVPGDSFEKSLYFEGIDEEGRMKFEWGYGYKLLVSQEDVTDMDGNRICTELFYGDWIAMFTLEKADDETGWKMIVRIEHIHHNLEYRVMEDSKKDAVQLLMVQKAVENQQVKVIIKQVSVLARGTEQAGWSFEDNYGAALDDGSIAKLLQEEMGEDTFYILARPNLDEYENKKMPMKYTYIPLDRKSEQDYILEGKVVCLVAGEIIDSNSVVGDNFTNDCKINFYLFNELPEKEEGEERKNVKGRGKGSGRKRIHMRVTVARRKFSLDESRLRILKNENPYYGCNMLVRLEKRYESNEINWSGNVTTTPARSKKSLMEWVSKQQPCFVILGKTLPDSQMQVEISPGILSTIPVSGMEHLIPGTLASLKVDQDRLAAEMILPGDTSYIPADGRAAELLVMDGSLKHFGENISTGDGRTDRAYPQKSDFTVAGFPQIKLKDFALLKQVIKEEPPRLAWIKKDLRSKLYIEREINVSAAYLEIDEKTGMPVLAKLLPEGIGRMVTQWNYISFKDGTIEEIVAHVRRGKWHYHDKRTGVWDDAAKQMRQTDWPLGDNKGGISFDKIPLFLTKNNQLRYEARELMKWCYSAREIYQNGLPEQGGWYPVAAADEERIWLELLPGKILDIPRKYLSIENRGRNPIPRSLEFMGTVFLNAGDEVKLSETRRSSTQSAKLLLEDIRYGIRYSFSDGAYLPVLEVKKGGVVLGGGLFSITVPVADVAEWSEEKMGWLNNRNVLECCSETPQFPKHFTVLLNINSRHRLEIKGMPGIKVLPAFDYLWGDAVWLRSYLWNWDNAANNLFADGIPMVVDNVTEKDGENIYRVHYPQPRLQGVPAGTEICCNMIGTIVDENAEKQIILRAGGYLICMRGTELLPGLPEIDQEYVCRVLAEKRVTFWMHKSVEGWLPGLDKKEEDIRQVELLACIPQADGIICRDKVLYRLWWLPKVQAARAGSVPVEEVFAALKFDQERQLYSCRVMEDGTVSLIHTAESRTNYVMLDMGSKNKTYRVIPYIQIKQPSAHEYAYLGELSPCRDIIYLISERELDISRGESIPVDILSKSEQKIEFIPEGMQRIPLHLSPSVVKALGESRRDNKISCEAFMNIKPERYKMYDKAVEKALLDANKGVCVPPEEDAETRLVYLYYLWYNLKQQRKNNEIVWGDVRNALATWVRGIGQSLATGFDKNYSWVPVEELDLLPSIAAILLLSHITRRDEKECRQLAVHLTRVLGMVYNNSMHQVYVLNRWLFQKDKRELWTRLSRLSFGGETMNGTAEPSYNGTLTTSQYKRILQTCESLRSRRNCPEELRTVSECLLFAIGAQEDYGSLYKTLSNDNMFGCRKLAGFGRGFLPGDGYYTVSEELNQDVQGYLQNIFRKLVQKESIPVTLITDNIFPLKDEEKKWAADLCRNVLHSR